MIYFQADIRESTHYDRSVLYKACALDRRMDLEAARIYEIEIGHAGLRLSRVQLKAVNFRGRKSAGESMGVVSPKCLPVQVARYAVDTSSCH